MPPTYEILFADDHIDYVGQPIGLVVASSVEQAKSAVKMIDIKYKEIKQPILTVQDAIRANSFFPSPPDFIYGNADEAIANSPNKVSGNLSLGAQFHFHLENHVAIASPTEDGIEITASTQYLDLVQKVVSLALGIKSSRINVRIKQLGGAYGGEIRFLKNIFIPK